MKNKIRAYTLIEMLTVIAITAILLTIIVYPVIQAFNLTRAGEAFADAQDTARALSERISREVNSAVSVRNLSGTTASSLNNVAESLPNHSLVVTVPGYLEPGNTNQTVEVDLPYAKMDLLEDLQVGTSILANGQTLAAGSGNINPVNGYVDPTLKGPKGQPSVPVVAGNTMVRYFIGLRNPFAVYNDPYTGILMKQNGTQDNLYVLYRAVVNPNLTGSNQPNTYLFGTTTTNGVTTMVYDDPRFFVADRNAAGGIVPDAHNAIIYHWMGQWAPWEPGYGGQANVNFAQTVVETQVSRYDMIMPQYNQATFKAYYDAVVANGQSLEVPRLTPLAQFRPAVVSNDPAAGQEAVRQGQESNYAQYIGPDTYQAKYGYWSNAIVRTYPSGFLANTANDLYQVGFSALTGGAPGFSIYAYNPASGTNEFQNDTELFDLYTYENDTANGVPYAFTKAALAANSRSGWLSGSQYRSIFTPYDILTGPGLIHASFDISEVGVNSVTGLNIPGVTIPDTALSAGQYQALYPNPSTNPPPAQPFSPLQPGGGYNANYDINAAFNYVWLENASLQPSVFRFLDLRVIPNQDGTYGPLYPGTINGGVNGFRVQQADGSWLSRVRIVPGSEVIWGPDQNPGVHYGQSIRYVRVTGNPGPNQYTINYVDQQEPTDGAGKVDVNAYQAVLGAGFNMNGFDPTSATYDPTNFVSAQIQPRYKAGYVQFDSDPNTPIPQGYLIGESMTPVPITVDYRFQFTGGLNPAEFPAGTALNDVMAVDYDTRQLMEVLLTVRNYAQTTLPNPQYVTLKATATVRNPIR